MIKGKVLKDLIAVPRTDFPITSAYFSVGNTAATRKLHLVELKKLIRYKQNTTYFKQLSEEEQKSVLTDFEKIMEWYDTGLDTSKFAASITYSSGTAGIWKTIDLKRPLTNDLVIQPLPYIRPLVGLFSRHRNYALILVDRAKARLLESRLGVYKEHFYIEDNSPESVKVGGYRGREERKVERNIRQGVKQHYKEIAQRVFDLNKDFKFNWIIIGGRKEAISEFRKYLHDYVASKVQATVEVEPSAALNEVLEKVGRTEERARADFEAKLLAEIEEKKQKLQAVEGMEASLEMIRNSLVQTLVIHEEYRRKGVFSRDSDYIGLSLTDSGNVDAKDLERTNDVVEHLIHLALKQNTDVEFVRNEMQQQGGIAAILRYPIAK